jgi:hypothetical protein
MNDNTGPSTPPKRPSLLHNWISLSGIVVAAASLFAVISLFALDSIRGFRNPYIGILTYIVSPVFLVLGLLLILGGVLLERRRRRRLGETAYYPRLDLNDAHQRHVLGVVAGGAFAFLLLTAIGVYRTYEFTESVMFCGKTCHSIMTPEYTAYQQSPHAQVECVKCHIGPSAGWYVESKLSGAYQVYATIVNKYPRPIPTPIHDLRPLRETCEQCHWPRKFFGEVESKFNHYLPDEKNSRWNIRMLVKVGGDDPEFGAVGGIHWHVSAGIKVEFIAKDKQQQTLPWVRLTDATGHVTVFESSGGKLSADEVAAAMPKVMDCVNCHNRPTHIYYSPVDAVDLAMSTGRIDPSIPYIKEQAVQALTKKYESTAAATTGISDTLNAYYRSSDSTFAAANAGLIDQAVKTTQRIYTQNFFPDMKVNWQVYPDNIGHWDVPGCFRCHDGEHKSKDGKTIPNDCNTCHTIVAQGPTGKMKSSLSGIPFQHPVDISDMWQGMLCSDCHEGSLVD